MKVCELECCYGDQKRLMSTVVGQVVYDPNLDSFMLNFATMLKPEVIMEYHINKLQEIRDENSNSGQ